jgi:hypothetical protein
MAWTTCAVDDDQGAAQNIRNDVLSLDFSTPRNLFDWTGLDKSAMERGLGLEDFSCTLNGVFNDAAGLSHAVFHNTSVTSVVRTVTLTVSGQTLAQECVAPDYQLSRGADGLFTWTAPLLMQNGVLAAWTT